MKKISKQENSKQKKVKLDIKSSIINASIEQFAYNTVQSVSVRTITKKAGVNVAAINYYFGTKENLYICVVEEICERFKKIYSSYHIKSKEIKESKNKQKAKELIVDFMMERVILENSKDVFIRSVSMIITREELFPSQAYDIIYKELLEPTTDLISDMICFITDGKIASQKARILAQMLFGQIVPFVGLRAGFTKLSKWKKFSKKEYESLKETFLFSVDKMLS